MKLTSSCFLVVILLVVSTSVSAAPFSGYRVLKISAPDQRAVVKLPDGSLKVIAPGDMVDDAEVAEVVEGRVVLNGQAGEKIIVRFEQGRQRIESYRPQGEKAPPMTAPVNDDGAEVSPGGAGAR